MFCGFYLCKIYPGIFREGKKAHPEEERFISKYIGKEQAWDNRMEGIKSTYSFPGLHLHPVYLFNLCSQLFSCLCVLPFTCVHVYICAWLNLRHKAGLSVLICCGPVGSVCLCPQGNLASGRICGQNTTAAISTD